MLARCFALVALTSLGLGCSSTSTSETSAGPVGPASFALTSPADGACIAIGTDVTAHVPLAFETTNVVLRPPGACGSYANCGRIALRADGLANNEGASFAVDLVLGKLANPYHDGEIHEGTGKADLLPIEATLLTDSGTPMTDTDGEDLTLNFALVIKPSCE